MGSDAGIAIVGAGALGTLLAARLSGAGSAVRVLARRRERAQALPREAPDAVATTDAADLVPAAIVFLCVKAHDTESAARLLAPLLASAPAPVVSLQNGWGHMNLLAALLPGIPLVAATTTLGAYWDEAGRYHVSPDGETIFAPWRTADAASTAGTADAAARFRTAGFTAGAADNARDLLWRKLVLNVAVNPLTAIHDVSNGALRTTPGLWGVCVAAAREAVAVGAARGHLSDAYDPEPPLQRLLRDTATNRSSMAQDLARGRRTEGEAIVGSVVREGAEAGVSTPVIASLAARLAERESAARRTA